MQFLGSRTSSIIAWAMLPLLLLAGMPNASCMCADGQRKLFCPKLWGGAGSTGAACCCSNCCLAETPLDGAVASCCHGGDAGSGSEQSGRRVSSQPCCCRPERVEPAVSPSRPSKPAQTHFGLALQPLVSETSAVVCSRRAAQAFYCDSGPPTDLVVSLQRFLI